MRRDIVLAAANGQPGEAIAIPNLAARGGSFYLRVRAAGPDVAARGGYRLVVHLGPFDAGAEIEPNGDAAHATELAPGGEAVGYLGWRHDQDWYRLPTAGIAEGSVLSVDLDPLPEVAATLQLYGADAHKLTEARGRKGERVVLRNVRIPPTDPFVFVVVRADVGFSAEARYNLRPRTDLPKAGTEAEPNDDQAHAQPIGDGTVVGYLARGDVDFFRYSTDGMALLDLEVTPPERGGVEVEVTREDNTLLARAASARRAPARIAGQPIPGGPILIRVVPRHGPIDSDDPYRLTVTSRPAPPPGEPAAPTWNDGIGQVDDAPGGSRPRRRARALGGVRASSRRARGDRGVVRRGAGARRSARRLPADLRWSFSTGCRTRPLRPG